MQRGWVFRGCSACGATHWLGSLSVTSLSFSFVAIFAHPLAVPPRYERARRGVVVSGLCDDAYFQKEGFCLPHTHINFPSCLSLLSPHQQNPAQALTAPSIRSQQRESHSFSPSSCADPSCGGGVRKGEYVRVAACVVFVSPYSLCVRANGSCVP